MTEFDLHGFVEERLSWALPSLQERGMTAADHVSRKETVRADRGRLGQVLSALVDNAVRYASDGRLVEIDCRADASTLELIVRDRGKSASVDDVSRFFERFWRSERSRSRYAGGTGLGLSVVQAICKAHGGEAKAAARPGGGLEIRICLPRDQGLRRSIGG